MPIRKFNSIEFGFDGDFSGPILIHETEEVGSTVEVSTETLTQFVLWMIKERTLQKLEGLRVEEILLADLGSLQEEAITELAGGEIELPLEK